MEWNVATQTISKKNRFVGFLVLLGIISLFSWCVQPSAEKRAQDKEAGFHCLSPYDGSHRELVENVKATLREPDSFEHVSTRVTPKQPNGTHKLMMTYRARNGFGGMNTETVSARYRNDDCAILWWHQN